MTDLKPCPFCHKTNFLKIEPFFEPSFDGYYGFTVVCSAAGFDNTERGCGAAGAWGETEEDAATTWNTRPAAPVEGLETVRYEIIETLPSGTTRWQCAEHKLHANSIAVNNEHPSVVNALVHRSQAGAIIAARDAKIADLENELSSFRSSFKEQTSLKADNAALTARVARDDAAFQELIKLGKEADTKFEALETQLAAAKKAARSAHDTLIEINPSNYDHDDVCQLNDASVEAIFLLADVLGETHGKSKEWWDKRRAALEAKP